MKRLAVVVSHPIQYYAPVFQLIASKKQVEIKVFYTWGEASIKKFDPGFKRVIEWDVPLLNGYSFTFLKNTSKSPGTQNFKGIINPTAVEEIRSFEPDAIMVYGWAWKSHLKILRYFSGKIPVWFRGDSTLLDDQPGIKQIIRFLVLKRIYRYVDSCFYVGTSNKAYFKKLGLRESQLVWAPHAIDNSRFQADRSEESEYLRKSLQIPRDSPVILFAGKFESKKDPILLLDSFINLSDNDAYLIMVGNGALEEALKNIARKTSKANRIKFLDFQNQDRMPVIYQACQLFCLPSKGPGETWGLAVNEAMAAGKAVLLSDKVGCAADLVKEGENGSTFPAGDGVRLQSKLKDLLSDKKRLIEMGKRSQQIIKFWSFDAQAEVLLKEIKML